MGVGGLLIFSSLKWVQNTHRSFFICLCLHPFPFTIFPDLFKLVASSLLLLHSGRGICLQVQSQSLHPCTCSHLFLPPSMALIHSHHELLLSTCPFTSSLKKSMSLVIITLSLSYSILSFLGEKKVCTVPPLSDLMFTLMQIRCNIFLPPSCQGSYSCQGHLPTTK